MIAYVKKISNDLYFLYILLAKIKGIFNYSIQHCRLIDHTDILFLIIVYFASFSNTQHGFLRKLYSSLMYDYVLQKKTFLVHLYATCQVIQKVKRQSFIV